VPVSGDDHDDITIDPRRVMRVLVAISGATGAALGVRVVELLHGLPDVETHLIISKWGKTNIKVETPYTVAQVERLADRVYENSDLGAAVSSGSYPLDAMIVVPCSMKTLAGIRHGIADTLIARAADVMLKERRTLCLAARETPLSPIHLENMLDLSRMGVSIAPPMPSFYTRPHDLGEMLTYTAIRMIDQIGVCIDNPRRWTGIDKRTDALRPSDGTAQRPTLMWEVRARAESRGDLAEWVNAVMRPAISAAGGCTRLDTYISDDHLVVVIADNLEPETFAPPKPDETLVAEPPSLWFFTRL
jgi:flavin prenyltransferase